MSLRLSWRVSSRWFFLLGGLIVAGVVLFTYYPSLNIGFWMDDYIALDIAGRVTGIDYLIKFFDPRVQRLWYRPMVGMQWGLEYLLFRAEPIYYHLVQVFYHFANSILLFALTARITRRKMIGLIAALLYATFPLASMSIYWTSVHDPLAIVCYLLTIWFWLDYLESKRRLKFVLAFVAFLGALLTKEVSATLPIVLFLADRVVVREPARLIDLVKRYFIFAIPLGIYAWFEWIVTTRSEFTQQIGYHLGPETLYVFFKDLALLAFPWDLAEPLNWVWLAAMLILFAIGLVRDRRFLLLGAIAVLPTLIVSPIPLHLFNPRYLYFPLMASAVGYALLVVYLVNVVQSRRWAMLARGVVSLAIIGIVVLGSFLIAESTENFGGFIRQIRLQFRPIYQKYPTFPPNTLLYFTDTPLQTLDISGLMFLRYGTNVTVRGVDRSDLTGLRDYASGYVWYKDEQDNFKDQMIEKNISTDISPAPPTQFGAAIMLDSVQVVNSQVRRGDVVIVLLRWKALAPVGQNYTTFVHLINDKGEMVTGYDSQPRNGLAPTSTWRPDSFTIDSIALPITNGIAAGQNYRLEIGLYDRATSQRLSLSSPDGTPLGDHLSIESITILE
jgi:hypothetical protein